MYHAPAYIQKAVSLIDKDWFVAWNPRKQRWQIRMWVGPHKQKDAEFFYRYVTNSIAIMTVCYYDDDFEHDIGYKPLDERTLHSLRVSRRNADNPESVMQEIDEHNEKLEREFEEEIDYMMRDAAISAWKHFREPMVDLGANT